MKKYQYILFDFDGTISDSYDAVVNSFIYALDYYGNTDYHKRDMRIILGPPLRQSFVEHFGFDEKTALEAVKKYRERYNEYFLIEHKIYKGIPELLQKLCDKGYKLVLATSKPLDMATKILEKFDLAKYFYFLGGASLDTKRDTKEKVLEYIFENCNIDKSKAILVGDRCYDLIGAEYIGIDAMGVLFGYGDKEELVQYKSVYIAQTVEDIDKFFEENF